MFKLKWNFILYFCGWKNFFDFLVLRGNSSFNCDLLLSCNLVNDEKRKYLIEAIFKLKGNGRDRRVRSKNSGKFLTKIITILCTLFSLWEIPQYDERIWRDGREEVKD